MGGARELEEGKGDESLMGMKFQFQKMIKLWPWLGVSVGWNVVSYSKGLWV